MNVLADTTSIDAKESNFEIIETTEKESALMSIFAKEQTKRFVFQCRDQEEMIAWVAAMNAMDSRSQ